MKKFLLRLRRRSIKKLKTQWENRLGYKSQTVPLAMLIGVTAAVAAGILHELVSLLEHTGKYLQTRDFWFADIVFILLPLFGIILSYAAQRNLGGNRYAKSLSPLILSLNRRRTSIPLRETFSHVISSALSVGCGGSAGLEAPSVLTGAAIGANTAGFFGVDRRQKMLMIGCGAAAAISAIFQSPVGGVLFAIEVLLPEFSVAALIPMLISSAVALVVSRAVFQHEQALFFINPSWRLDAIPYYFLCGIVCAAVGVLVIKSVYFITSVIKKHLSSPGRKIFIGGILLCLILAAFPILRGQGYYFIIRLLHGDMGALLKNSPFTENLPIPLAATIIIAAAIILKAAVSALTVESGGDGGIFAPTMFIGAFTGFAFARLINLSGIAELQEENFIIVGMGGVFSAVLRAPLTGIFLIAEVTYSYVLLVPLMIVSSLSHAAARWFEPNSIYRKALAEADLLTEDRDQAMLRTLSVRVCITPEFTPLAPELTMKQLRTVIENAPKSDFFPVLDQDEQLLGIVQLEQITPVLFDHHFAETMLVFDLMSPARWILNEDDDLARAMNMLEHSSLEHLPVKNREGKFMGFVSGNDIFKLYRGIIRESSAY
ncbi:MAG: chloride channel protein [Lentisphaerae bacterium]|nr:chloride channel protein [Lentisphaerota bacterium]MBE6389153.1 chloride channel protein [Lentisphaerota bacterium]